MNNDLAAKYRNEIMQYYEMRKKKEAELNKGISADSLPQNRNNMSENMVAERINGNSMSSNGYPGRANGKNISGNILPERANGKNISDTGFSGQTNRTDISDNGHTQKQNSPESIEERYPEPELPEFISQQKNNADTTPGDNYHGVFHAEVTTGERALPVEDAFVIISSISDGTKKLIAALLTDRNGKTIPIEINTPQAILSENIPYSVIDVVIYKDGFYSVENKDVSVYSGTSSIQPVSLIPLPASTQSGKYVYRAGNAGQTEDNNQLGPSAIYGQTAQINRQIQNNIS